jgi:hypothetical protein
MTGLKYIDADHRLRKKPCYMRDESRELVVPVDESVRDCMKTLMDAWVEIGEFTDESSASELAGRIQEALEDMMNEVYAGVSTAAVVYDHLVNEMENLLDMVNPYPKYSSLVQCLWELDAALLPFFEGGTDDEMDE